MVEGGESPKLPPVYVPEWDTIVKFKLSKFNALRFDCNTNVYQPKERLISTDTNFVFTMSETVSTVCNNVLFFHNRLHIYVNYYYKPMDM